MAAWRPAVSAGHEAAEQLLPQLVKLRETVQEASEQAVSFRKHNEKFEQRNETTQLLKSVAEQLWNEKLSMEQANFEEHNSELPYLCQHFDTKVDKGLADNVFAEKALELLAKRRSAGQITEVKPRRFYSTWCSAEFPPQQSWWLETKQLLVPKFPVLRNGKLCPAAATDLVPGDIVYVCSGQQAAADARVLVTSGVTAVDFSHLTSRPNDVRICSPNFTGSSVTESRNMLLKDGHVISGALFCMVVRTCMEPFIPPNTYGGQEIYEVTIDMTVPAAISLSTCQGLFKTLCTKANLFCKTFAAIEKVGSIHYVVVMLTQELLGRGTVPAFCTAMAKLKRVVFFVNCNCGKEQLASLCRQLGVECSEFEEFQSNPRLSTSSKPSGNGSEDQSEARSEVASTSSIDVSLCTFPVGQEQVGDHEKSRLTALMEKLQSGSSQVAVINGISQVALIKLCLELGQPDKPLLYVMADFHYPKCFRTLAIEPLQQSRNNCSLAVGTSEESTGIGTTDRHSPNSASPGLPAGSERYLPSQDTNEENPSPYEAASHGTPCEKHEPGAGESARRNSTTSIRSDPAPHLKVQPQKATLQPQRGSQVFVSVNSIGIVSDHSDCILLNTDLGLLGLGLEIIAKKLRR